MAYDLKDAGAVETDSAGDDGIVFGSPSIASPRPIPYTWSALWAYVQSKAGSALGYDVGTDEGDIPLLGPSGKLPHARMNLVDLPLTGTPTAPTPTDGDDSTTLATTEYFDRVRGVADGVATLDSGGKVPTAQLPAAVLGGVSFQGTWNATTNSPSLASGVGTKGYYYVVATAGTTTLDTIAEWAIGDWAIFDGTVWRKVDNTDAVVSVAGLTGAISVAALNTALNLLADDRGETAVASATTCDIGAAATTRVEVTGTTTITSFGSVVNKMRIARFAAALTLTHNATTLILPGASDIATAAGDVAILVSDGSGNWRCVSYLRATGAALNAAHASSLLGTDAFAPTSIASAATTNLGTASRVVQTVTGTTTITSFGTGAASRLRVLVFEGALTLTHDGTSLILPTGANITTAAGDTCIAVSDATGANWRVTNYQRADGTSLVSSTSIASKAEAEAGSDNTKVMTPLRDAQHVATAKAYVSINAAQTAINHSFNVTSYTDSGTGDGTMNMTTALSSANYLSLGHAQGIFAATNNAVIETAVNNTSATALRAVSGLNGNGVNWTYTDYQKSLTVAGVYA